MLTLKIEHWWDAELGGSPVVGGILATTFEGLIVSLMSLTQSTKNAISFISTYAMSVFSFVAD